MKPTIKNDKKRKARDDEANSVKEAVKKQNIEKKQKEQKQKQKQKPKQETQTKSTTTKQDQQEEQGFTSFQVIVGTYQRLLYGMSVSVDSKSKVKMEPIFHFPAHLSCIKAVNGITSTTNSNKSWLATGSTDEAVKLWDLSKRKEIGELVGHRGVITDLVFPSQNLLLTASEDSSISIFRTRDWALLKTLKGHKGAVNALAIHPNGRVLLSVGRDKCLRLWDIFGKKDKVSAGSTKLGQEGEIVRWNKTGDQFAVLFPREIRIYATDMTLLYTLDTTNRFNDIRYFQLKLSSKSSELTQILLVGCEDGHVRAFKQLSDKKGNDIKYQQFATFTGHSNRIKALSIASVKKENNVLSYLCTASSDGKVNIYSLDSIKEGNDSIEPLTSYDTKGARLTCLAVVGSNIPASSTTENDEIPSEEEDDEEDEDSEDFSSNSDFDSEEYEIGTSDEDEELKYEKEQARDLEHEEEDVEAEELSDESDDDDDDDDE